MSLALDEQTGRHVAVKEIFADPRLRERLRREVALLEGLHDSGIVSHLGVWFEPDVVFAVMPWIEGASLREVLDAGGALSVPEVLWIGATIARALMVAHHRGIVHRDVKPANVLLDLAGNPYLCDFGVAKGEGAADLTRTGGAVGSPAYMSPEQVQGDFEPASDQYSLGVVCWELLVGRRPFRGSAFEVQLAHLTDPAPPVPASDEDGSAKVADIVQRMLVKNPGKRWVSLGAVADAFDAIASDSTVARATLARRVANARRRRHFERLMHQADAGTAPRNVKTHLIHAPIRPPESIDPAVPSADEAVPAPPAVSDVGGELGRPARRRVPVIAAVLAGVGLTVWALTSGSFAPSVTTSVPTPAAVDSDTRDHETLGMTAVLPDTAAVTSSPASTTSNGSANRASTSLSLVESRKLLDSLNRASTSPSLAYLRLLSRSLAGDTTAQRRAPTPPPMVDERAVETRENPVVQPPAVPDSAAGTAANRPAASVVSEPARSDRAPVITRRLADETLARPYTELQGMVSGPSARAFLAALKNTRRARPVRVESNVDGSVVAVYELPNRIGRRETWEALLTVSGSNEAVQLNIMQWKRTAP